jgi:hypothetical protein
MPKATKCSNHRTTGLFTHTTKLVGRILRRTTERKTEDVHEDQSGFRGEKGTRDTTGMQIISERTCVCFTDWQKTSNSVTDRISADTNGH